MKDIIIVLLLLGLLWGGYKGMTYLGSLAQTDTTESEIQEEALADNSEKRLNKSAIKELQKSPPEVKQKKAPIVEKSGTTTDQVEKTNGQKAMEAVRQDTRLDVEGKQRSKEDFYKEPTQEKTAPYERKEGTTKKQSAPSNDTDIEEQKVALAEKGKALAGEFTTKGALSKKKKVTAKKTVFNIEKGENEAVTPPARPQEYNNTPSKKFTPSKYILVTGSYASADNAVKEVLRLKKLGYPNTKIVLSEKNLNLVSLGSFSDRTAAKAEAAQIKKRGIDLYVKRMR